MKRRLFLKSGSVGVGGIIVMPSLLYGCKPAIPQGPAKGISLFIEGAELFDNSVAELRLAGSGELASAESEDVTLAGIGEQIAEHTTAESAELDASFEIYSSELLVASTAIYASAPEMFPFNEGDQAEIGDDYALLKVAKSATILASAAMATPRPIRKVHAAEKMVSSAEVLYQSIEAGAEDDLISSSEELLAHSEEYVGAAEVYSAEEAFVLAVHNYGDAANRYAEHFEGKPEIKGKKHHHHGADSLLTSTDNIELSSEYYGAGFDNLNASALLLGLPAESHAAKMIPFSEHLVAEAGTFEMFAQGESAELGTAEMLDGAEQILTNAETNASDIGFGGPSVDYGADRFIAGTMTYVSAEHYNINTNRFYIAAEELFGYGGYGGAEKRLKLSAELLYPQSELFYQGAAALQSIKFTEGVESLIPATSELLEAAEQLQSIAKTAEAEFGAENMVEGAAEAEFGAAEAEPGEFLAEGAESVEMGTFTLMNGAAEFIEGYN